MIFGAEMPGEFEVRREVVLGSEPQRADMLILRRPGAATGKPYDTRLLRGLWPRLGKEALVEYKSPNRPLRRGDLARLLGYGAQYFAMNRKRFDHVSELSLVLMVGAETPTLHQELTAMGWELERLGNGYSRILGCGFGAILVVIDEVSVAEDHELLGAFGNRPIVSLAVRQWWFEHVVGTPEGMEMRQLEGYEEMEAKFVQSLPLERRLAGLAPEERLAGLAPEERLAGLAPEERLRLLPSLLPVDVLRSLTPEALAKLPEDVREAIKKRIG